MNKQKQRGSFSRGILAAASALLCLGIGCTAEIGETESAEEAANTEQSSEELFHGRHKLFCGGKLGDCDPGGVCLSFIGGACAGPRNIGICLPKPRHCPPITHPVCGCDGETYANHCEAAKAGTGVASHGACEDEEPPPPDPEPECGGPNNIECPGSGECVNEACECKVTDPKCAEGETFDADPAVCACVVDACAGVKCPPRTQCVVDDNGEPVCQ